MSGKPERRRAAASVPSETFSSTMERPDSLDTSDVEGAQTRRPPARNTAHPFNRNDDIELSRPFSRTANPRSLRCTNPIDPIYQLPSTKYEPLTPEATAPRDVLWTLPERKWRPETRVVADPTAAEKYGRSHLFQQTVPLRPSLHVTDITGPQFRMENRRWRNTDPLKPVYLYNGGPLDEVQLCRPRHGSMYPRTQDEAFALRTDDITTEEKVGCKEYPRELIKTRLANRTDDILGTFEFAREPPCHVNTCCLCSDCKSSPLRQVHRPTRGALTHVFGR